MSTVTENLPATSGYVATEAPTVCAVGELAPPPDIPADIIALLPAPSQGTVYPSWEIALKVASYSLVMAVGILGNLIVILIVALNRRMRTTTNLYVANLALSDLLVSALCMWIHMGQQITPDWPFGAAMCPISFFLQAWLVTASIFFLAVIAGDRFFAIVFPLKAKMARQWKVVVLVTLTWVTSATAAMPHLFTWEMVTLKWKDRTETFCHETWEKYYYYDTTMQYCTTHMPGRTAYVTVNIALLYFAPIVVMAIAYGMIVKTLWARRTPGNQSQNALQAQQRARRKVVLMLLAVFVGFVVCWTPFQSIVLYDTYRPIHVEAPSYMGVLKYVFTFLAYSNSALNPVLYGGLNDNFRQGFREAFKCSCIKDRNRIIPVDATQQPWTVTSRAEGNTTAVPSKTVETKNVSFTTHSNVD